MTDVAVTYQGDSILTETDEGEQPGLPGIRRGVFVQRAAVCEVVAVNRRAIVMRTALGARVSTDLEAVKRLGGMLVIPKPGFWPWEAGK